MPLDKVRFELEETVVQLKPGSRRASHRFEGWRAPLVVLATLAGVFALIIAWAKHAMSLHLLQRHPWLFPVALVLLVFVVAKFFPVLARRKRLSAARVATPQLVDGAKTCSGEVLRLGRDVDSHRSERRAVISSLVLCPPKGHGVYLGSLRSVEFLLLLEDDRRVVVTGELFVPEELHVDNVGDAPIDWPIDVPGLPEQARARHWQLSEGDRVTLRGALAQESSTALPAGYRSDGFVDTLRGSAGHPVIVEGAEPGAPT